MLQMLSAIFTALALFAATTHASVYPLVPYVPPLAFDTSYSNSSLVAAAHNVSEPEPYNAVDSYFGWDRDSSGSTGVGSTTGVEHAGRDALPAPLSNRCHGSSGRIRTGNLR
jgi:hypothetical protein